MHPNLCQAPALYLRMILCQPRYAYSTIRVEGMSMSLWFTSIHICSVRQVRVWWVYPSDAGFIAGKRAKASVYRAALGTVLQARYRRSTVCDIFLLPTPTPRYASPPLASGRGPFPAIPPACVLLHIHIAYTCSSLRGHTHIAYTILAPPCGHAGLVVVVVDAVVDTVEGTFHGLSLLIRRIL